MKTLIKNATLLDMVGEEPNLRKTDILIEENKIEENKSKKVGGILKQWVCRCFFMHTPMQRKYAKNVAHRRRASRRRGLFPA